MDRDRIASLRLLLSDLEREAGLAKLTESQRSVYYAACLLASDGAISTEALRKHKLTKGIAHTSFFRSIKALIEAGLLEPSKKGHGFYAVKGL